MPKKTSKKEINIAIIVAVISLAGTIVTAMLSSPWLPTLFEKSPAETNKAPTAGTVLVFSEDFEDGRANLFDFDSEYWSIENERGNKVLTLDSISRPDDYWTSLSYGPSDFSDGIIEFKIKYEALGDIYASFRFISGTEGYLLYIDSRQNILGYFSKENNWRVQPFTANTRQDFTKQTGIWHTYRIEARGTKFTVYLDANRLFSGEDAQITSGMLKFNMGNDTKVSLDDIMVWVFEQ